MDFELPEQTAALRRAVRDWATEIRGGHEICTAFEPAVWKGAVDLGLTRLALDGGGLLDACSAFLEIGRIGLPGPLLECELALRFGSDDVRELVARGEPVTAAPEVRLGGRRVAAWAASCAAVIDEPTGTVLGGPWMPVATGIGLPLFAAADALPASAAVPPEALRCARWVLVAALGTGLARAALESAVAHTRQRVQFGRPLAAFQAVQFRLVEAFVQLEGAELCVLDAAARLDAGGPTGPVSAALAHLYAADAARTAIAHGEHVYGAAGFCDETGLVRLDAWARWLRSSTPVDQAAEFVAGRYAVPAGDPPVGVLATLTGGAAG